MLTLRARVFIITTIFVLVVLSIALFLFARNRGPEDEVPVPEGNENVTVLPDGNVVDSSNQVVQTVEPTKPVVITDPVAVEKAGVGQLARVFTERYQTFSTDNNYDNIRQIKTLVTASLWNKLSTRLSAPPATTFIGVTTEAFGVDVTSFGEGKASVAVQTRRTTEQQNGTRTVANQNYTVQLVKNGSTWLVDGFVAAK